ncbi:MAG: Jag N-terminal domain-containing protein [Candidatus Omnitrophota bacterium]
MYVNDSKDKNENEFEGETTEDAISKAEKSLGVERDRMEIKIVCEEKKGLFGMRGAKQAKIKVVKRIK